MQGLAFVVCNFLAIVFLLIPAPWHLSARNAPTLLYIFWCAVTIVPMALNSAIWYDHLGIKAPIYCDVRTESRATTLSAADRHAFTPDRHKTSGWRRRRDPGIHLMHRATTGGDCGSAAKPIQRKRPPQTTIYRRSNRTGAACARDGPARRRPGAPVRHRPRSRLCSRILLVAAACFHHLDLASPSTARCGYLRR